MKHLNNLDILDSQMLQWGTKLRDDINIAPELSNSLATTILSEISTLPEASKQRIINSSPINIKNRKDELNAFQGWMDYDTSVS